MQPSQPIDRTAPGVQAPAAPRPVAPPAARLPAPDASAQAAALRLVRELYAADYARTGVPAKTSLARSLVAAAAKTNDDVAARYVMLREAHDLASGAGDQSTAMDALDLLGRCYAVNILPQKLVILRKAVLVTGAKRVNELATQARDVAEEAVIAEEYDAAVEAMSLAIRAATALPPTGRGKTTPKLPPPDPAMAHRLEEIQQARGEFLKATAGAARLKSTPSDADAANVVGRYLCFVRGNFAAGLPLLKSTDPLLQPAIQKESGASAGMQARLEAANAWWDAADKQTGIIQKGMRRARRATTRRFAAS